MSWFRILSKLEHSSRNLILINLISAVWILLRARFPYILLRGNPDI